MSDGKGAASAAPAIPESASLAEVIDVADAAERWANDCLDVPALKEGVARLSALDQYLVQASKTGRARLGGAMRRLEERVGFLTEDRRPGRRTDLSGATDGLTKDERYEFRKMADNADVVEEVIASSTDDDPPTRRKVLKAIAAKEAAAKEAAAKEAATKPKTTKPKPPPPKGELVPPGKGAVYDPEVIDWVWLRLERGMGAEEISAATRSGDWGWPADRWPDGMSEGTVHACRFIIHHLQRFEQSHPMKRRPRYSGMRLREIAAKPKPLQPIDKVQRAVMQLTAALEGVDVEDYDLDGSYAQMVILDLYEDLGEHQGWVDKTVMAIRRHLDQAEVSEKIRKMREDTTGRTPAEIAAFRAAADRLERLRVWGEIGGGSSST